MGQKFKEITSVVNIKPSYCSIVGANAHDFRTGLSTLPNWSEKFVAFSILISLIAIKTLIFGFGFAYFGSAKTIVYFLMRKDVDERLLLKARNYHARLSIELVNTLHKGAVVRAMKQLSTKAKILVREVMQNESMIKQRGSINPLTFQNTKKKTVEFDENLQEIIETDPELQKEIG
jgi:hypothetical protein